MIKEINFQLGTVTVPVLAAGPRIEQNYTPLGGRALLRTLDGTGIRQSNWRKTRIVTSGTGWIPAGLQELDYDQQMILRCSAVRQQQSVGNVFTLPTTRRSDSDFEPFGAALLNGDWVETNAPLVGDIATLDLIEGATEYRVLWFPEFTVHADPPDEETNLSNATFTWTLTAEEV